MKDVVLQQRRKPESNPSLEELMRLNMTLTNIQDDLSAINSRLHKPVNLIDQIAKGVMLAGIAWLALVFLFQVLAASI